MCIRDRDGDLGAWAGCAYDMGAEETGVLQPMTFYGTIVVGDHSKLSPFISFYRGANQHVEAYLSLIHI